MWSVDNENACEVISTWSGWIEGFRTTNPKLTVWWCIIEFVATNWQTFVYLVLLTSNISYARFEPHGLVNTWAAIIERRLETVTRNYVPWKGNLSLRIWITRTKKPLVTGCSCPIAKVEMSEQHACDLKLWISEERSIHDNQRALGSLQA